MVISMGLLAILPTFGPAALAAWSEGAGERRRGRREVESPRGAREAMNNKNNTKPLLSPSPAVATLGTYAIHVSLSPSCDPKNPGLSIQGQGAPCPGRQREAQ